MSNRDRIARAAEEARLAAEERLAKKRAHAEKAPKPGATRRGKTARMKIVWVIYDPAGKSIRTFAYPDKDAGTAEAQRLSNVTGRRHELRPSKIPME
jgi:hypothetical protein